MCGRFTLRRPEKVQIEGVSPADFAGVSARYNVAPSQNILGVIQTNDERHARYLRALRNHGQDFEAGTPDQFVMPGFNNRMTEFQAALAVGQMERFREELLRR